VEGVGEAGREGPEVEGLDVGGDVLLIRRALVEVEGRRGGRTLAGVEEVVRGVERAALVVGELGVLKVDRELAEAVLGEVLLVAGEDDAFPVGRPAVAPDGHLAAVGK
jgi:hypothetical protein